MVCGCLSGIGMEVELEGYTERMTSAVALLPSYWVQKHSS